MCFDAKPRVHGLDLRQFIGDDPFKMPIPSRICPCLFIVRRHLCGSADGENLREKGTSVQRLRQHSPRRPLRSKLQRGVSSLVSSNSRSAENRQVDYSVSPRLFLDRSQRVSIEAPEIGRGNDGEDAKRGNASIGVRVFRIVQRCLINERLSDSFTITNRSGDANTTRSSAK